MKTTTLIGIVLIVAGALALGYRGITYTTQEKVVDLGPVKAAVERERTVPIPPVVGGAAVALGIVLVLVGTRRS